MADGQVVFEITADGKHAIASVKDVTSAIEKESKKWDTAVDDATEGMTGSFASFIKGVVGGLAAAGIGKMLLNIGKDAINAASDLAEVQNVVDVTFGDSAGQIESWAKQAGKQYGLTETAAKRYTSTIGAMLKSQGMADDEIVQTSTDLAGLAADMASFYNLDFETAFQKIRSGISGETEPLKQLGINMSTANLEAFALEKGITKAFSAMSQGEQTALRYQYIMKATADAQGDFARTADGFANASRRVETALETIKTVGGGLLLKVVAPLTESLATFLEQLTTSDTTVLDDIAAIDTKTGEKVSKIRQTAEDAALLAAELGDLEKKTSLTTDEQALWLETCKRLVQTIPGLNAIINTETGEVKGGTDAVREYVKAWEEGQTKLAMLGALQQKEDAISQRFSDMPGLQLDMAVAQRRVREQKKKLDQLRKELGIDANGYSMVIRTNATGGQGTLSEAEKRWNAEIEALGKMNLAAINATEAYNKQKSALDEAETALEEYKKTVDEMPGEVNQATQSTKEWSQELQDAGRAALEATKQALAALADYAQGVRDSTAQAVDSIVKGFENLSRPTTDLLEKRSKLIEQQQSLNQSTKEGAQKYEELQKQIDELNKSIDEYSPKGMQDGLKSQLAFMDEYLANLEKAQKMGLSGDLLASLSDGSTLSAEYLAQLVANPEQAQEVDALFQQVQEKKQQFTDALTEQKLTVDETYQAMVDSAKKAVESMDLGEEAKTSMGNTIGGLASGIMAHVPDVADAVNAVIAEIRRLQGLGISVKLGSFGSLGPILDGQHETGLDYVPFDGYLAGLHEGEGILTAEENRIWQRFKNGAQPQTMDYDALGATMRDNVKAGGNVYLDGRTVGRVISAQQGADYRALKRSGWQS